MKLRVDGGLCSGHGRCYALAPEVYAPDPEGYNAARDTTLEVSPDLEGAALRGLRGCPEQAIGLLGE